ncbi:hypothetical protein BDY24DRAFT_396410 [Mrakia frigida]|uniref:uncharacterized protein n=1 Tax=Mrakia frigida TaxID=29902 RepID=UPI003FCBF891
MADSKPRHYSNQLDKVLTAGTWADPSPASAPNGTALPWAELVRKYEKHVGGTAGALALNLRTLTLYLTPSSTSTFSSSAPPLHPSSTPTGSSTSSEPSTASHYHRPHLHTQHPIPASFVPANDINPRDLDGDDRSGRPTSNRDPWASCRAPEERIREVEEGLKDVRELVVKAKVKGEKDSALLLEAFHLLALGRYHESLNVSTQVEWGISPPSSKEAGSTEAAFVERVRGKVVEGLCHELSSPPNQPSALASYTSAVHLLETLPTLSLPFPSKNPSSTTSPTTPSFSTSAILKEFTSHRELWRWAEHALFRGSLLASSSTLGGREALKWLRTYHFYETVYPASFRPERRASMLLLYVRALALEKPLPSTLSNAPSTVSAVASSSTAGGLISRSRGSSFGGSDGGWAKEVEGVMRRGMAILEAGGARGFPKAGEKRAEVEEFVVGCVGLWERGGEKRGAGSQAGVLLQLLWWATTQTFNSQPILRHLTRLLLATSAPLDARRTFELYVKIVDKARETSDSPAPSSSTPNGNGALAEPKEADAVESDNDRTFVETLVFGGRLIGKECGDPREGLKFLKKAEELSETSTSVKEDVELKARIQGAKGLLKMAWVIKDHDPLARAGLQTDALKHLTNATLLSPSSAKAFYNLAYAQAECREIDASTLSIRSALELEPSNVHGWHLLTLLLTAKGKWHDAAKVADIGLESWDGDEEGEVGGEDGAGLGGEEGDATIVGRKDFVEPAAVSAPPPPPPPTSSDPSSPPTTTSLPPLLGNNGRLIPMSSLLSYNPSLFPTKAERLEAVLQLRMTQTVIVERLEGPEVAMERQQELFAFFSARCGKVLPPPPSAPASKAGGVPRSETLETNGASSVAGTRSTSSGLRRVDFGTVEKRSYDGPRSQDGDEKEVLAGEKGTNGEASSVEKGVGNLTINRPPPPPPEVNIEAPNGKSIPIVGTGTPGSSSSSLNNMSVAQSEGAHRDHHRKQRFLPKHLLSPSSGRHHGLGRSASLSRLQIARQSASSLALNSLRIDGSPRRSISNASSIHSRSRRPSPTHSEYGGGGSGSFDPPVLPPVLPALDQEPSGRTPRETRLLSQLWLMSAATFRRWGKLESALAAIQEAEVLDATNPEVWVQLGLYHDLLSSPTLAISCFIKALVFDPLSLPAQVHLARLYLLTPPKTNLALAHGTLNSLTQGNGWDCSEAWYFLAKVCELQEGREERVRECLEFGKKLEDGRCVRPLGGGTLERWI